MSYDLLFEVGKGMRSVRRFTLVAIEFYAGLWKCVGVDLSSTS